EGRGTTAGPHPWTLAALAVCYSSLGRVGDVEAIRDELVARARREHVQASILAIVAASLGRMDETFELLERACEEHDGILVYSKRYPFFKVLRADPRMARIYRRIGFPDGASYGASSTSPYSPTISNPIARYAARAAALLGSANSTARRTPCLPAATSEPATTLRA